MKAKLLFIAMIATLAFTACSSDDEEKDENVSEVRMPERVESIDYTGSRERTSDRFVYDERGRIVHCEIVDSTKMHDGDFEYGLPRTLMADFTYDDENSMIYVKNNYVYPPHTVYDFLHDSDITFKGSNPQGYDTLYVKDNKIIYIKTQVNLLYDTSRSAGYEFSIEYSDDNRLKSFVRESYWVYSDGFISKQNASTETIACQVTWSNGNITSVTQDQPYGIQLTSFLKYGEQKGNTPVLNVFNLIFGRKFSTLAEQGLFGEKCANLPSEYKYSEDSQIRYTCEYDTDGDKVTGCRVIERINYKKGEQSQVLYNMKLNWK